MNQRQQQLMDSLVRVRAFLDAHPLAGMVNASSARQMLDEVEQRVRACAGAQHTGLDSSRMEVRRQEDLIAQLLDQFIRPIVTIARAQLEPESDVGLPAGLRMPKLPIGPTRVLAMCDGMIASARPHEAVFIANGMPADFLERFATARNALERVMVGRATQVGVHVAARAGLEVQLRRGRRALDRVDAIVRASFRGNEAVLATWRGARRVHLSSGVSGSRGGERGGGAAEASAPSASEAGAQATATESPRAA